MQLDRFARYSRTDVGGGQTAYSLIGTPIDRGPQYELPQLWEIETVLTLTQYDNLTAMYHEQEKRRRTLQPYAITLQDTVKPYTESNTAATRKLATGATTEAIGTGGIKYYAEWTARILTLDISPIGDRWHPYQCTMSMSELDRVLP
ncbi:MAG: hypothetical protein ACRC62_08550 [Microcoleus sp.]